jgi:hypothetical protein
MTAPARPSPSCVNDTGDGVQEDFNTPLCVISGNAQLLQELSREAGLDEQFAASARDIQAACRHLSDRLQRLAHLHARRNASEQERQ